jgi:hypothetical protein
MMTVDRAGLRHELPFTQGPAEQQQSTLSGRSGCGFDGLEVTHNGRPRLVDIVCIGR